MARIVVYRLLFLMRVEHIYEFIFEFSLSVENTESGNDTFIHRMRGEAWDDMHYTQIPPKHSGRFNNSGIYTAFFDTEDAAQNCYLELLSCRRSNNPPSEDAMVRLF